jgi:hypothetical protein
MASRPVRWLDKAMLSTVMAVAAFVLERIVIRASKKSRGVDPRDEDFEPPSMDLPRHEVRL